MNYLVAVDDCFLDAPGGMARVAWDMAREMAARGHCVTMLCGKRTDSASDESHQDGIRVVRYARPQLPGWHPLRAERVVQAAAQRIQSALGEDPDLIHMHSVFTGLGALAAFAALNGGPRCIFTVHSPLVLEQQINWASQGLPGKVKLLLGQGKLRRLERSALADCSTIHTLSHYTRTQVERFHGLGSRVSVIPHWRRDTDRRTMNRDDARQKLGWPRDQRILFTLRRHGPRYGLDLAIRAASPLLERFNARLVVAGDGPLRPQFQALARDLGAGERIVFPGRLSDTDLALAYQGADLFLLPTLALECFGLIILEAFSYGCPVLSSDVCAIPETMQPITPEFLFPAGDVGALQAKLRTFLEGQLSPPSSEALFDYVNSHFGREVILPRLLSMLEGGASNAEARPVEQAGQAAR